MLAIFGRIKFLIEGIFLNSISKFTEGETLLDFCILLLLHITDFKAKTNDVKTLTRTKLFMNKKQQ